MSAASSLPPSDDKSDSKDVTDSPSDADSSSTRKQIHLRPESQQTAEPEIGDIPTFSVSYGDEDARKLNLLQKNPLVPAGALITGGVLMAGMLAFKRGNTQLSQTLMRARVVSQGATLIVLAVSVAGMGKSQLGRKQDSHATPTQWSIWYQQ